MVYFILEKGADQVFCLLWQDGATEAGGQASVHELSGPKDQNAESHSASIFSSSLKLSPAQRRESACAQKGQGASLLTRMGGDGSEDPHG